MKPLVIALFTFLSTLFQSRRSLQIEIVALRHQLNVYQRTVKRPRIGPGDRVLWSWFARRVGVEEFSSVRPDWDSDCLAA